MCGIAGGWWTREDQAADHLTRALRKIGHRGPDSQGQELYPTGDGFLALGHTRLSIIDLSEAGHQPMHTQDQRFSIIFNGEIFNYRELRSELQAAGYQFHSDSDTEVLLAAWAHWGPSCLTRLIGMFAFAVLDKASAKLTCARDPFGIKPLFYAATSEGFRFASEAPALLELLPGRPHVNWQIAYDYLVHGDYDSTRDSFFEGVRHLPPAHYLSVDLRTSHAADPVCWWTPSIKENDRLTFADATEKVRDFFLQSIRLHLRSDVPLGAALSGGIDSSAVVCAMRHVEPNIPIHTFSFIAEDSEVNEERWVDRVNRHVDAIAHKVTASGAELARDLEDMILAQGEPFGSTSIYAQYRVFQLARESGVTVTLDGQGADELLAGYNGYPGQRLRSLLETGELRNAWRFFKSWPKWPGRSPSLAVKFLAAELADGSFYQFLRKLNGRDVQPAWMNSKKLHDMGIDCRVPRFRPAITQKGRRVVAELAQSLTGRGLPALLRHGDRNSMRFSVESRVPFLTSEFAELLLSLPEDYLISRQGETKHVFRAAMRGIVPDDVLNRRDKIGFATPEQKWLLSMADTVRKWLSTDMDIPILLQAEVLKEFDSVVAGQRRFSWQVWRWINFARWHAIFFK